MASNWRNSREYRIWRATVIRRDKRCVICGSIKERHAHHLNHATYFPEERFNPDNGVTICGGDHRDFHYRLMKGSRKKCTKSDFTRYVTLANHFKERFNIPVI
jgi:5-methylcytosine-specific restriction endonuclease McrA